jgi:hypothetical protein
MSQIRRGLAEGFPYSLSRWTDLPAGKWEWFRTQLAERSMIAMDPRTGLPDRWSLDPADTLGLVFWTRNCRNLVKDARILSAYQKVIHFTLTGWHEVESKAPGIEEGLDLLASAVEAFGVENVRWRFSPVPIVNDAVERFQRIAARATTLGIKDVYLAFVQDNDWAPETRTRDERQALLSRLSKVTTLELILCNDDLSTPIDERVRRGICEDGLRFGPKIKGEGCGCALLVDPFSQNEACPYGCLYCYSANQATSPKKRNTTRLRMLKGSTND